MADIRLVKPQANAVQNVPCAAGNRFVFDFPSEEALFAREGNDLVLSFEDGSSIRLQNFYTTYSKEQMPSFEMEGAEISGEDFFAALGDPNLMPAAGPAASAATRGGGFNEYGDVALLGGIDRLGGLDISFNWGQEPEDDLYAYGHRDVDYGVTVTPGTPETLDPETPVIDDPDNPNDGGVGNVVDRLVVHEAGLADGSRANAADAPTVATGSMVINAPDGIATITIGSVTVFANGQLVRGEDGGYATIATDEGVLQVTGFDRVAGCLTYTYTLKEATQEHTQGEADNRFAHLLPVTVTDTDGDTGTGNIAVVIVDDNPEAHDDANSVREGESEDVKCSGNVLDGTRSDGGENSNPDVIGADGHMSDVSMVSWDVAGLGSQGGNTYKTDYGTITLNANGSYTYTLDGENAVVRDLLEGQSLQESFTYTITDADGDTSEATLTITIQGTNHTVSVDIASGALVVDEADLADGSKVQDNTYTATADGSMTITAHDGLETVTIGGVEVVKGGELLEGVTIDDYDGIGTLTFTGLHDRGDGTWILDYTYTLNKATQEHTHPAQGADRNELPSKHVFEVHVWDQDGSDQTGSIKVDIVDDVPIARDDFDSVTEKDPTDGVSVTTKGNVIEGTRGDDQTSVESGEDTEGADTATVTGIATDSSEGTVPADGSFTIEGEYGSLTIYADGSYTYTLNETNTKVMGLTEGSDPLKDSFTYTLTDADGDRDTAELVISIHGKDHEVNAFTPEKLTVDEAELPDGSKAGSDQEVTANGSFEVVVKDGLGKLFIGDKEVQLEFGEDGTVQVADSTVQYADPKNGTAQGYLTIDSVQRNDDGFTYTVSYTYHLTKATQEHAQAQETEDGRNQLKELHSFGVTVVDQDGDTQSGNISIDIVDDVPTARDDFNSITEADPADTALVTAKGNVITGMRGDTEVVESKDTQGADTATVTGIANGSSEGTVPADGSFTIQGEYGSLTIYADGSYTYTLNETNTKVMGLTKESDPLKDSFTYTLTDADGDRDTAKLVISIHGKDHDVNAFTPEKLTVDEAELPDGSKAGSDQEVTANGSFDVVVKDGLGKLFIGDQEVKLEFDEDGSVRVADSTAQYADPKNGTTGQGQGYLTIDSVQRNDDGFTYTVSYTYHLTKATQEHDAQGKDSLSGQNKQHSFEVTVVDQDKDEKSATISIDIVDDVADAQDDQDSVQEKDLADNEPVKTEGNVITGERGDEQTSTESGKDTVGADGANVTAIVSENNSAAGTEAGTGGQWTVTGQYGTLTINADGCYTYTLDESNRDVMALEGETTLQDVFTYTLTDKDGDSSEATLTIDITGTDHEITIGNVQDLVVDEADLNGGNAQDSPAENTEASGSMFITAKDGLASLSINETEVAVVVDEDGKVTGIVGNTETEDGKTHFADSTGYLTIDSITDKGDGTYEVHYTYHLENSTQEHEAPASGADRNTLEDNKGQDDRHIFTIVAKDQDTNTSEGRIQVDIIDDVPTARDDWDSVTENDPTDGVPVMTTGNVIDGERGDGQTSTVSGKDTQGADTATVTGIASGSNEVTVPVDGSCTIKGEYGILTIEADGSYSYALAENNRNVMALEEGETLQDVFTYTLTDADGDSSKAALTITITGTNHSDVVIGNVQDLVVDEANLNGGNAQDSPAENTEASGSMLITAKDGLASLTINGKEVDVVVEDGKVTGIENSEQKFWDGEEGTGTGYLIIDSITDKGDGTYEVHYTYHLENSTQEHEAPASGADRNTLEDNKGQDDRHTFTIVAKDQDQTESAQGQILVDIIDDVPTAKNDFNEVTEHGPTESVLASGNVITGMREDTEDAGSMDIQGADTATVTSIANGSGLEVTVPADGSFTIEGKYGTLTINANGSYIYDLNETNREVMAQTEQSEHLTDEFTYTLTDKDGDSSEAKLTIDITGTDHGITIGTVQDLVVDEADLTGGNAQGSPEEKTEASGTMFITAKDGLASLTINGKEVDVVVEDGKVTGIVGNTETEDGKTHFADSTGYLTIDSITDNGDGTYEVNYTYHLENSTQEHDFPDSGADRNTLKDNEEQDDRHTFTIVAKDQDDNNPAQGQIKVDIVDDIPVVTEKAGLNNASATVLEEGLTTSGEASSSVATIDLAAAFEDTVSVGADGLDSERYELQLSGESVGTNLKGLAGEGEDAEYKNIFLVEANGVILGVTDSHDLNTACFRIEVNPETGELSFTLFKPMEHLEDGEPTDTLVLETVGGSLTAQYTVTDKDGDTVSVSLDLGNSGAFKIVDDTSAVTGNSGELAVDESYTVRDGDDADRLATGDTGGKASNVASLVAYTLFDIDLSADDMGLEETQVNPVFTLSIQGEAGEKGQYDSGLWAIAADADGESKTEEIQLALGEDGKTITGTAFGNTIFTVSIDEDGTLTLTMAEHTGISIKNPDTVLYDEAAVLKDKIQVNLQVTDRDGDTNSATADVTLKFEDDGPALELPAAVDIESKADTETNTGTLRGKMTFDFGADGQAFGEDVQAMVVMVEDNGTTYIFNCVKQEDGTWKDPDAAEDSPSFSVDQDGQFIYSRPLIEGTDKDITITVTLKDGDGDTITEKTTEYVPFVEATGNGELKETGVAGCTNRDNPNEKIDGTYTTSGTISLAQSSDPDKNFDNDTLTLQGWSATLKHTILTENSDDDHDTTDYNTSYSEDMLGSLLDIDDKLVLYLRVEYGHPCLTNEKPGENEDFYGTITFTSVEDPNGEWNWTFELARNKLTNSMTEQETIELNFDFKVSDGMLQGGGALHITIQGTNDMPMFTCETQKELPDEVGDAVVNGAVLAETEGTDPDNIYNGEQLHALDPDTDNGEGAIEVGDNHLRFTVVNEVTWNSGQVTINGENPAYSAYEEISDEHDLLKGKIERYDDNGSDKHGKYSSITTNYGILNVYEDGHYTYIATNTDRIGADEYVTETFTIRVTDAHGSYSDEKIVITLRDTDHEITGNASVTLETKEAGVAGDDSEYLGSSTGEDKYNTPVEQKNGTSNDFLFKDVDINDTLTINLQTGSYCTLKIGEEEETVSVFPEIELGSSGEAVCYLVASKDDNGDWTFKWTTDATEGADVVGTLVFTREDDGSVNPSFELTSGSDFLDQLEQKENVSIELPLSATSDGASNGTKVNSTLSINIEGTNDRPEVTNVTIGNKTTDKADVHAVVYPEDATQVSDPVTLQGEIRADDVDKDNFGGAGLVYTLEGTFTPTAEGPAGIPQSEVQNRTSYQPQTEESSLPEDFSPQYTSIETTYGTLTIVPGTGAFTYTLKEPAFLEDGTTPNAIMALGAGQSVTETFTIRVTDVHGSWITKDIAITINGTNDRPVLTVEDLEVHATEDNIPDSTLHDDGKDHSTATVTATDYDHGDELTYCFHDSNSETDDTQFVITAGQLLNIIDDNGTYNGTDASKLVLKALLEGNQGEVIATLRLSAETGELTLEVNQESVFIQALNGGDELTFKLSDIAEDVEIFAKDNHNEYSSNGAGVSLVLHGNDDSYTPVSVVVPHVKEEGVYRDNGGVIKDTTGAEDGASLVQPGYGQHQFSNSGSFTINDRDAGQVVFSQGDTTWNEAGTTLNKKDIVFAEGEGSAQSMYVLGDYGYYVIDLHSNMDANGTKTFEYTYHLYTDSGDVPGEVIAQVEKNFDDGWQGRLETVDSIAQGEQVNDRVSITVSTGGSSNTTLTLESIVSGSNDRPEITDVDKVATSEEGAVALDKITEPEDPENPKANTMHLEDGGEGQTLHITLQAPASGETSHFVGQIEGADPDTEGSDGTRVINYAFVHTGEDSSHSVWTISEDGQGASSEFGYISIDADGVFHIHLYEGAAKDLGEGKLSEQDIFGGLGVRCIDDLGATSNIVNLSGHLLGVDDAATATDSREDLWEGVHDHDTSIPAQDLAPEDAPLAESGDMVQGEVVVTDPDSSDTFSSTVTVTIGEVPHTLGFDENGNLSTVDGEDATELGTGKGTFDFTLHIEGNTATLKYTYTVNETGLDEIDKLDDGEIVSNFEELTVGFTSIATDEDGTTETHGTSSATISIDVHGTNDAPVIQSVQTGDGATQPITDETIVNGGTLQPKEQVKGKISSLDPDEEDLPEGETSELTYGVLIYTDAEDKEHIVYGETGKNGVTQYVAVDGTELPNGITLENLTFTNHADLDHGSIYVDDKGNYTYSRYPEDGEQGFETVYITVRDPSGAMDHVEIRFDLEPAPGDRLPDVTMKGDIPLEITEPSRDGDRVHVGDEESSASSFTEAIVENLSITVHYYQDNNGTYHVLDKDAEGNWVHLDSSPIPVDADVQAATGKLEPTVDGSYRWAYTDEEGNVLENFNVPLDIRLTPEGDQYGWGDGTYSLQTDYGTVYVDRATGELRFELDSRADSLNAGEIHTENVVIWINGDRQNASSLNVTVTGTADPSEVETDDLSIDLHEGEEETTVAATGTLTIEDIDNADADVDGARDSHTLTINVTDENGATRPLTVTSDTTIYVMAGEDGQLVYTDAKPQGENRDSCYGQLSFDLKEDGSYEYTFTAYRDSTVSKEIENNDHLELRVPVSVTDTPPESYSGGTDTDLHLGSTTSAEIVITVTGQADAPGVAASEIGITEEGTRPGEQGDGSHSVSGKLEIQDYDGAGVTVTGISGSLAEGEEFANGSTVVQGQYGTLVLNSDGTYTYTVNYDEVQDFSQGHDEQDIFTVAVSNAGGQSLSTITVNVQGVNDAPTVTVTPVLTVQEQHGEQQITVSGRVDAQDIDSGDMLSYGFSTGDESEELTDTLYVVGSWGEDGKLNLATSTTKLADGSLVGTLSMNGEGEYTFTLEDSEATRSLALGDSAQIEVQAGANDGHATVTKPVTITIRGSNEAPEVSTNITIGEDSLVNNSVTVLPDGSFGYTATDADRGTTLSYTFSREGEYRTTETGTITVHDTEYQVGLVIEPTTGAITISYDSSLQDIINALGAKDTLAIKTDGLQVVVQDGEGGRTSSDLSLTIRGENDDPIISATMGENNTGSFTFTDVDTNDTHTISVVYNGTSYPVAPNNPEVQVPNLGTFTFEQTDNGWTYHFTANPDMAEDLPEGVTESYNFQLQVSDGTVTATTEALSVTVTSTGQPVEEEEDTSLADDMSHIANALSLESEESDASDASETLSASLPDQDAVHATTSSEAGDEGADSSFENALRLLEAPDNDGAELLYGSMAEQEDEGVGPDASSILTFASDDFMVSGALDSVSFMVSEQDVTLDNLLNSDGSHLPIVSNVEVLITGEGAESLTNMDQLAKDYGISVDRDTNALNLDASWQQVDSGNADTHVYSNGSLTLETTLEVSQPSDDLNMQAAMQQVNNS